MTKKKLFKYALLAGAAYLVIKSVNGGSLAGLGYPPGFFEWPQWKRQEWWRSRGQSRQGFGNTYAGDAGRPDTFSPFPYGGGYGYPWGGANYGSPWYNPVVQEQQGTLPYMNSYLDAVSEGN